MKTNYRRSNALKSIPAKMQRLRVTLHLLLSRRKTTIPDTCGDPSDTPIAKGSGLHNIVSSIRYLRLREFIQCYAESDITVLADQKDVYTEHDEQILSSVWMGLLSQYYAACDDKQAVRWVEIHAKIRSIQCRQNYLNLAFDTITKYYNEGTADILRKEYPQFKFNLETCTQDIQSASNMENHKKRELQLLNAELETMSKSKDGAVKTPEEKRSWFIDRLLDITKHEGAKYDDTITVEVFARLLRRLELHIEQMQKEAAKHKK